MGLAPHPDERTEGFLRLSGSDIDDTSQGFASIKGRGRPLNDFNGCDIRYGEAVEIKGYLRCDR